MSDGKLTSNNVHLLLLIWVSAGVLSNFLILLSLVVEVPTAHEI